jgi:hypothetical protein
MKSLLWMFVCTRLIFAELHVSDIRFRWILANFKADCRSWTAIFVQLTDKCLKKLDILTFPNHPQSSSVFTAYFLKIYFNILFSFMRRFSTWPLTFRLYSYPCNRPWRPIGLWKVEVPTFSRHSDRRWCWGCQPYAAAALYLQEDSWYLFFVRACVDPRAIVRLEGLG